MEEMRLRLKARVNKDLLKELVGGISDKRFYHLQKLVVWELDTADFKSISLVLYLRLGGWSHTGGTFTKTMNQVQELCKAIFGYEIPKKFGKYPLKGCRYWNRKALAAVGPIINRYHEKRVKKG